MRKRKPFLDRIGEKLDIPREALPGGFGLALSGRGHLHVCGCARVLCYSEEEIALQLQGSVLKIFGEGLLFTSFSDGEVEIGGLVCGISFAEGKG